MMNKFDWIALGILASPFIGFMIVVLSSSTQILEMAIWTVPYIFVQTIALLVSASLHFAKGSSE